MFVMIIAFVNLLEKNCYLFYLKEFFFHNKCYTYYGVCCCCSPPQSLQSTHAMQSQSLAAAEGVAQTAPHFLAVPQPLPPPLAVPLQPAATSSSSEVAASSSHQRFPPRRPDGGVAALSGGAPQQEGDNDQRPVCTPSGSSLTARYEGDNSFQCSAFAAAAEGGANSQHYAARGGANSQHFAAGGVSGWRANKATEQQHSYMHASLTGGALDTDTKVMGSGGRRTDDYLDVATSGVGANAGGVKMNPGEGDSMGTGQNRTEYSLFGGEEVPLLSVFLAGFTRGLAGGPASCYQDSGLFPARQHSSSSVSTTRAEEVSLRETVLKGVGHLAIHNLFMSRFIIFLFNYCFLTTL